MDEANPTPLGAERERLRKAGYTDAEISQILIQRAVGGTSQQPAAPAQGTMTGVLGNASAVLSHARGTIPAIQSNIANVSNPAAPPTSRVRSAAFVALAAVIVAVLGYAIYQEWQQHIVSATEIAAQQAREAKAKADTANTLSVPLNPTPAPEPETPAQNILRRIKAISAARDICKTPADPTARSDATNDCVLREAARLEALTDPAHAATRH